jgi:hypothetical protein
VYHSDGPAIARHALNEPGLLPVRVAGHGDDPLGTEPLRRQDRHQTHGTVTDDDHGLIRPDLCGDGAEPPGPEHIGRRQQMRDQFGVGFTRQLDPGSVGMGDAGPLRLRADRLGDELGVHAFRR